MPLGRIYVDCIRVVQAGRDHDKAGVMEFRVVHECMQLMMAVHVCAVQEIETV